MRNWVYLGALSLAVVTHQASAQGTASAPDVSRVQAAAEEFDAARRAYGAGNYALAADRFEGADRLAPATASLRNAIRSRLKAEQPERAANLAESAILRYPDDAETRKLAEDTLKEVAPKLHQATIVCAPACTVLVDGVLTPWADTENARVYLKPGDREIAAGWGAGSSRVEKVSAIAGGSSSHQFEKPPEPKKPPTSDKPKLTRPSSTGKASQSQLPPWAFYAAAGVTVAVGAAATWSGLDMQENPGKDKVRADCVGLGESCPTYQDALAAQSRTNWLIAGTAVAATGTAVLGIFFTDWSGNKRQSTEEASITPTLSVGSGVGLGAAGRF